MKNTGNKLDIVLTVLLASCVVLSGCTNVSNDQTKLDKYQTPSAEKIDLGGIRSESEQNAEAEQDMIEFPNHVSPKLRKILDNWIPYWEMEGFEKMPSAEDYAGWRANAEAKDAVAREVSIAIIKQTDVATQEYFFNGVRVVEVAPEAWQQNQDKVLIHMHGGGLYSRSPETMMQVIAPIAVQAKTKIVSVDYKLMPQKGMTISDQRDEVITVYKYLIEEKGYQAKNIGFYGCSAGGILTLNAANELSHQGYPLPGAIIPQSGVFDWAFAGDTYKTLNGEDPIMHTQKYAIPVRDMLQLSGENEKKPEYSAIYDDFANREFPPTLLQAGGREIIVSDSLRMYKKLKQAGHEVEVDIQDGMPHCVHSVQGIPEGQYVIDNMIKWFEKHIGLNTR